MSEPDPPFFVLSMCTYAEYGNQLIVARQEGAT